MRADDARDRAWVRDAIFATYHPTHAHQIIKERSIVGFDDFEIQNAPQREAEERMERERADQERDDKIRWGE